MKLYIKNMVCIRCKMMVKAELGKLDIAYKSVELGEVQLITPISEDTKQMLSIALHKFGLELMYDKKAIMIEKIINIVIEMVHYSDELPQMNFSTLLCEKMGRDYHKMSEIFSKTKGMTIEHFIIIHKVEKVKELIIYDELSLSEIAYSLNYSSVSHLSNQFKKITGYSPTYFKNLKLIKRKQIEDL